MLKLRNTFTGDKEKFIPMIDGKVSMYVCGMTVYDYCHIGHARVLVVFDVLSKYLRYIYGDENVVYVRNITDIDDKIIARALHNNEALDDLTGRYIAAMHEDTERLGVQDPDMEPRATHHMPQIIAMIATLIEKEVAYQAQNGDVYFRISAATAYGRLARKNIDDLRAGIRVEVDDVKENPLDFVLWKHTKLGEPSWNSPWGKGRPGWHIECSAMSMHCLGDQFDIHGGGLDLKFPHHENEIAQSEGCSGHKYVNYWVHNGFVRIDSEKMSKSLGNYVFIRDVLQEYKPEVVRYFIISSHYQSPLNYSEANLENAKSSLFSFYRALVGFELPDSIQIENDNKYSRAFFEALDDDLNTPVALSVLFEMLREVNKIRHIKGSAPEVLAMAAQLKAHAGLLGLLKDDPVEFLQSAIRPGSISSEEVNGMIERRALAKREKNWEESDHIRDCLAAQGVVLEDSHEGQHWRRA